MCLLFAVGLCVVAFGAPRAWAVSTVYQITLNHNGGDANPDSLRKICRGHVNGQVMVARPNSDNTCPTTDASYSTVPAFSLSSSPINEFPQKYANHTDATDGYETFLGSQNLKDVYYMNADGTLGTRGSGSSGTGTWYTWWGGVTGVTPFSVNYYDGANNTLLNTKSCTFGVDAGCEVLTPVGLTPPAGKYFDGWFCRSTSGSNCRSNRYLPANYATLSTPITPYGNTAISNWPNISVSRYRNDLRNANGDIVTNMSYEYTGQNTIYLYAAWAPYNVRFFCNTTPYAPFVGTDRTQTTYLDNNNVVHDIVYGAEIPLEKNFGDMCKSVYYEYDLAHGNDQWCPEYLDDSVGIRVTASSYDYLFGESPLISGVGTLPYLMGTSSRGIGLGGNNPCPASSLYYSCGSFDGASVPGTPPNTRYSILANGAYSMGLPAVAINTRQYPRPALPYKQTNGEYEACSTYTITPTAGPGAGVPQTHGTVVNTSATDMGYGCCEKPQYAEFKGYQVRRNNPTNGTILNNGELIQPGQFGAANCNVSFDNNTNPNTWQPGCDLWPWNGTLWLTAIWEHTPIMITLDNTNTDNTSSLLGFVHLKYGEYFYFISSATGENMELDRLPEIPRRSGYTFGGYKYCDANDVCTMIVDSEGYFISGANNLKFTHVDGTATINWVRDYTMRYSCGNGGITPDGQYTDTGTPADTGASTVRYGDSVSMGAAGTCHREFVSGSNSADNCSDCFNFNGWSIDAESTALGDLILHDVETNVSPWGNTNNTDWCIIDNREELGLMSPCNNFIENNIASFVVTAQYTPKQYDITYMYATGPANNDAYMPTSYTYTHADTIRNADQTPPAHGAFKGWCDQPNGGGTCWLAGEDVNIRSRDHGEKRLYAQWECDTGYTLGYDNNDEPVCNANTITCAPGTYLEADTATCEPCLVDNYCEGGEFTVDGTDQGLKVCATEIATGWYSLGGTTATSKNSCFYPITLDKNGYSGTISADTGVGCRVASTATGTNNATLRLFWNTACTLPTFNGFTQTGYTNSGAWSAANTIDATTTTTIAGDTTTPSTTTYYVTKPSCAANYYKEDSTTCALCSTLGGGLYTNSASDNKTDNTVCYASIGSTEGKYIANKDNIVLSTCASGSYCPGGNIYWPNIGNISICLTGYTDGGTGLYAQNQCKTTCGAGQCLPTSGGQCVNAGTGNWSAGGVVAYGSTLACNSCGTGLTTVGYGYGADEAEDCGRILHIGTNHVYLRSGEKTRPSLHVKIGDTIFYGNMSTTATNMSDGISQKLKMKYNNTTYSVYDDSASN